MDWRATTVDGKAGLSEVLSWLNKVGADVNRLWGDGAGAEAVLTAIVNHATALVPGALISVYTYDAAQHSFAPLLTGGHTGRDAEQAWPGAMAHRAVEQVSVILSYDNSGPPASSDVGGPAVACLPLVIGKDVIGVLCVSLPEARHFSDVELLLLTNIATQAATALHFAGAFTGVQRDLARKADELRRLRHAGLLISSRTRLDDTLVAILQMALEVTEAKYGIFRLVDKEGKNLITRAIAGERLGRPATEALPINATSIMGLVAKQRQPVCIPDVHANPWSRIYYPLDHSLDMRSELAVPLIGASGRLEGVLNLESPVVGAFNEEDSHLLQALATQAVIAIQEVRLLDALQETTERLLTQPLQQVLDHLVELACDLLNAGASAIWTLQGEQLILSASSGGHVRGDNLSLHGSLTGQAILSRGPVTSEDVRVDPRFSWPSLARAQGWKQALVVPLLASDGEAVGAFSVYSTETQAAQVTTSDWEKKVLMILAHYAALAVRHAADQSALRAAEEQRVAAETFAAMGDIAANLLHRLNNKIGTIPVRIEGIQDKSRATVASDAYLAANLEEIGRSAREAMDTVRDSLLHLQTTQLGPVRITECLDEALAHAHLPDTVQVTTAGLPDLPPVLAGQRGLTLVFANLLENAADAMSGTGRIDISGHADQTVVEIEVRDSGPGIDPALHERIFELDYSGRRGSRSGKLGFGLWWVKTWMTRLGGAIVVQSDGRRGTCFRLRLPRAEVT